jgi:hypothetical protein
MKKLALCLGLFILLLGVTSLTVFKKSENTAKLLDKQDSVNGAIYGMPLCNWSAEELPRVLSENSSISLKINTKNTEQVDCETVLGLRAPGFDVSPAKDEQKVNLKPDATGSLSWIISPRKTGTYEVALTDNINTKSYGLIVKNIYGLNSFQTRALSWLGTIFGPMLTVPWWWDRLKKKSK